MPSLRPRLLAADALRIEWRAHIPIQHTGLTQVQLAEAIGVTQQTLAHYEANRVRPLAGALSNLATQLWVAAEELLGKSSAKRAAGKQGPRPDFDAATADRSLAQTKRRVISQLLDSVIPAHR
jgi:transcriptional regulator with XRE-family HTH domain